MGDSRQRIDNFLKLMASGAMSGYCIDKNTVYNNLIFLDIGVSDVDISSIFNSWIKRFEGREDINVFVDPNWSYFCQFVSPGYNNNRNNIFYEVKLYIPLDREHIFEGANQLFDFLEKENIHHMSKVGKHIRFDDIVVRVDNSESANKIIDFVNNNPYLKEGSLPLNPFAAFEGNVSVAWDGNLSYNSVVSSWISEYINWERDSNNLSNVSYSRFYAYVKKMCDSLFEKGIGLQEFTRKLNIDGVLHNTNNNVYLQLLNYYHVTQLLLMSLNSNLRKEDIYKYASKMLDRGYQRQNLDKIYSNYNGIKPLNEDTNLNQQVLEQQKGALKLAFTYMCEKYGYNSTRKSFLAFLRDGNYDRITRYKGARELLKSNDITKEFAEKMAQEWFQKNTNIEKIMNLAFQDTYDKFGYYQVASAIRKLFVERNFSYITNQNGYRLQLMNVLGNGDLLLNMMEILTRSGYKIEYDSIDKLAKLYFDIFFGSTVKRKTTL